MLWKTTLLAIAITVAGLAALNGLARDWVDEGTATQCLQDSTHPGTGESAACMQNASELVNAPRADVQRWFMLDNIFIVVYVATFVLIAAASARTIFGSKVRSAWRLVLVSVAVGVAFAAGGTDAMENMRALEVIRGRTGAETVSPEVAREIASATMLKWMLLVSAVAISGLLVVIAAGARLLRGNRHVTH